jgi:hypothetical protein
LIFFLTPPAHPHIRLHRHAASIDHTRVRARLSRAVKHKKRSFLAARRARAQRSGARITILSVADGSALPSASIVQCAFPGTPRERVSYSADNRQRGFLPPARRNRCVPLRRRHSARRSTYQSVPGFPILH